MTIVLQLVSEEFGFYLIQCLLTGQKLNNQGEMAVYIVYPHAFCIISI